MSIRSKIGPFIALAVIVATVGWMLAGGKGITTAQAGNEEESTTSQANDSLATEQSVAIKKVRATVLNAESVPSYITLAGTTRPSETLAMRASYSGTVTAVNFTKGDFVEEGQAVLSIDSRALRADIARAKVELEEKKLDLAAAKQLENQRLSSKLSLASAQSALSMAKADLQRLQIDLEHTKTRAPFSGVLNDLDVSVGELLQNGDHIGDLVALAPLTIAAQIPQKKHAQIALGNPVIVDLDDGRPLEGVVSFIDRVADKNTRSLGLEVDIANPDNRVPAGISAKLKLQLPDVLAHSFSPALLSLNDAGHTAVKTLTTEDIVEFTPVTILRAERDKVWVTGLPDTTRLITVGQGFVKEGEQVLADFQAAQLLKAK